MYKITEEARWKATVYYKTENGICDVEHWLEELADLDGKVEAGPHWDTVDRIEVVRVNHLIDSLTVEKSETL